jgi:hypothetical protein
MDTTECIDCVSMHGDVVGGLNIMLLNRPKIENTSRSIPALPAMNLFMAIEASKAL